MSSYQFDSHRGKGPQSDHWVRNDIKISLNSDLIPERWFFSRVAIGGCAVVVDVGVEFDVARAAHFKLGEDFAHSVLHLVPDLVQIVVRLRPHPHF